MRTRLHPPPASSTPLLLLLLLAGVAVVTVMPGGADGQADMGQSLNFWGMTQADKIVFLADYLAAHDDTTRQIIKIAESLRWMEKSTDGSAMGMGSAAMPAVLDALPDIFNSSVFKLAVYLTLDELSRAMPADPLSKQTLFNMTLEKTAPYNVSIFSAAFNETMQKLTMQYMLSRANWGRGINRFLTQFSARDVLYETPNHRATVDPQCYSDTMDFIDAAVGATVVMGNVSGAGSLNLEHSGWALKMLDSYGKVSGGIMRGALHYVGSYEECLSVHAYLPKNSSLLLGRRPHDYVTEFDGRFCRVTFDIPDAVTESFGVDTRGVILRLEWGMCFPDSCHDDDVKAMFHLGMLQRYNVSVYDVYCVEEKDVGDDASAIVAIVILAVLGGTVVVCTLVEAMIQFYNNNCLASAATSHGTREDRHAGNKSGTTSAVYHNNAYQPTEGAGQDTPAPQNANIPEKGQDVGLPRNYIHHQEGEGDSEVKVGLPGDSLPQVVNGDGAMKRNSPPPSYSPQAENAPTGRGMRVPRLVQAFSVLTNMPKVLSGKKSPQAIHCLHGIRFFSMLWILLGHTYNYGIISAINNPTAVNLVDADALFHRFTFQAIMAGGFTVDTFFVLSGLLVTYLTLKDLAKSKKKIGYWVMFYVHRFWRLTPIYMVVLMTFGCLHTYLSGGPLWPKHLGTASNCKHYWWTNLLYVNNLVEVDNMCMGWSWYLANDMQFYWISPFFLLPLFFLAPLGVVMVLLLMGTGIGLAFYAEHESGGDLMTMHKDNGYWEDVYIVPWCRVAAYTVGMMLGFLLYKVPKTTLKMSTAVIGWVLTWAVGLFLCYITYTKNKEGGEDWNIWVSSAYESFGRPAWGLCVAWIIFACHNNRGGFINSILSWEGFLPVSRLTYAAYLVHPVVMILHVFGKKYLLYIDDYELAYLYMGHVVTSYLTAFVFSLVAEAPALALEKLALRRH